MTTTTLALLDILKSQFPGVEWRTWRAEKGSLTAVARISCFALRYRQTSEGIAFTILCGGTRVFHDEQSQTTEGCITAAATWWKAHIQECQQAIEED